VQSLSGAIPIPPAGHVELSFLGPSELRRDRTLVDDANWRRTRVRQLLACLVVHRSIRRERLADLLWPDATAEAASANLRMTLSYVHAVLEPGRERGDAPWFIRQDAGQLQLRETDELRVDVWDLDRSVDLARSHRESGQPSAELDSLLTAVGSWRGDPFAELGDTEWLDGERERLRRRFTEAAERAGVLLVAAGRTTEADDVAERGLAADPWSEALHRVSIAARRAADDPIGARRAYERCSAALAELGVEPAASTRALLAR
jgi:DNA-binding SARP family transcriptional activator